MKYVKLGMTILFSLLIITACQDNGEVNDNDTVEATTPAKNMNQSIFLLPFIQKKITT